MEQFSYYLSFEERTVWYCAYNTNFRDIERDLSGSGFPTREDQESDTIAVLVRWVYDFCMSIKLAS